MYYEGIIHKCSMMKKYLAGLVLIIFGIGAVATPLSLIQVGTSQNKLSNLDDIPNKEDQEKEKKKSIEACVDFDPDTLNCKSKGKWVNVRIHFSNKKDITTVNLDSILFNGELQASKVTIETGNNDDIDKLVIKFDRCSVINILLLEPADIVEILIKGTFNDGVKFIGKDSVHLINY